MSDEQILKTLQNIQIYCKLHELCEGCKFKQGDCCQIEDLGEQLRFVPSMWDMFEIGAILDE